MAAVEVAYEVSGQEDGPVLVLSNSLGSTRAMWDPNLAALEERFRVVRYDTRGHGDSPVPAGPYTVDDLVDDAVALLDRLGVERAAFAGLSLGGMTGMALAARHPERVERLALLCTGAYLDFRDAYAQRAALVREKGTAEVAEAVVSKWFTPAFLDADDERRQRYVAMVAATPAEGYAAACEAISTMDLRPALPTITAPTLVIAGADDQAIPQPYLESIAEAIPGARFLSVPESAHLANIEQPDVITPALVEFLGAAPTTSDTLPDTKEQS